MNFIPLTITQHTQLFFLGNLIKSTFKIWRSRKNDIAFHWIILPRLEKALITNSSVGSGARGLVPWPLETFWGEISSVKMAICRVCRKKCHDLVVWNGFDTVYLGDYTFASAHRAGGIIEKMRFAAAFWANWLFSSLSVGVLRFKIRMHLHPSVKPCKTILSFSKKDSAKQIFPRVV